MAYRYYDGTLFRIITPDDKELFFTCFEQCTRYGFRHVCFEGITTSPDKNKQISKQTYYNGTKERYQFESVLEDAIKLLDYNLSDCRVEVLIIRRYNNGIRR